MKDKQALVLTGLKPKLIMADWPAPPTVKAFTTTRQGGASLPPYDSFNLGSDVGDQTDHVSQNRQLLMQAAGLPAKPLWLQQEHGTQITTAQDWRPNMEADAIYSDQPHSVCCVMTADCLPVLLCDQTGQQIAAVHAGWRGLLNGIIEKTVRQFHGNPHNILAWLGPAIGPDQFKVGEEVFHAFIERYEHARQAFKQTIHNHYLANIYQLATQRLAQVEVKQVYGGQHCTVTEIQRFFSYRRDKRCGRMASIIWMTDK